MVWRLLYATVFLGLVLIVGVSLPASPAEATDYQCANITVPWPLGTIGSGPDRDCDGFSDSREDYMGTHKYVECAATNTASDERLDQILSDMPTDFNDDQLINGQDSGKFGGENGPYNHTVAQGPFYVWPNEQPVPGERFDFNGNGIINGQDTGKYQTYGNHSCLITPTPPPVTTSRYMYLTNPSVLTAEGCSHGAQHLGGAVILDFGAMVSTDSTELFRGSGYASFATIKSAVQAYLNSYINCGGAGYYLFMLVGTSTSDPSTGSNVIGTSTGAAWAGLVNDLNAWISSPPSWSSLMQVAGAIDIEPEQYWAPKDEAVAWANAFDSNTSWGYINYGPAECTPEHSTANNPCGDGTYDWKQEDIFEVSYGISAAFSMPEIYSRNGNLAAQWDALAYYASNTAVPEHLNPDGSSQGTLFVEGALTQSQACADFGGNQYCYDNGLDNPPNHGWRQLYVLMYGDSSIPPNPLGWSSDITKRN